MEELLIVILQVSLEIVAQVLLELPWDLALGSGERRSDAVEKKPNYLAWSISSLVVGALVGGVSLLVVPHTLIRSSQFRVAYLFLAPIASASTALLLSRIQRSGNRAWVRPTMHGLCAFLFAVTLTTIRFAYAER